jgi:hypothetical protein
LPPVSGNNEAAVVFPKNFRINVGLKLKTNIEYTFAAVFNLV